MLGELKRLRIATTDKPPSLPSLASCKKPRTHQVTVCSLYLLGLSQSQSQKKTLEVLHLICIKFMQCKKGVFA